MSHLADRMSRVEASPTLRVAAQAERLRAEGVDIVDFGAGEPDFATPDHIVAAAHRALDERFTKYTANVGIKELRRAIVDRYEDWYGVSYTPNETIVTAGGKQALYNAALALFGFGDQVVTHSPGWPTIPEQVKLADAQALVIRTHAEDGFRLHAKDFLAAITPRTRGIIINSPTNPTGAVIAEEDLAEIVDEAARRDIWILLDLCYERLIYDPVPHNLPGILATRHRDRTVLCGSMSKAYAMTGWRCGWAIGPSDVIEACAAIQSNATSNVNSITQKAAIAALRGPQDCVTKMLDEYRRRRDAIRGWLTEDPRFHATTPAGAFYLFVDVSDLLSPDGIRTSADLAQALLDDARVVLTPGEAFDAPGFVRISYATSMDRLEEGARRIHSYVQSRLGAPVGVRERRAT